ncbi:MAG: pseudouridine-5'-phosphate glycosidase [Ahrensia sp.]|nr:pseudouridine-5'-phosphate glycosidase [Ahrensia sp.]
MSDTEAVNSLAKPSHAVAQALQAGAPVVALESTIITHGMPFPQNLETAHRVEAEVRGQGATPATIAVIDGELCIGLADHALEQLAQTDDVMKLSRADLAFAMSQRRTGSTTVAATMMAAKLAGIGVFATGGIGGVHKGAEESFDISADLEEFSRSDVIVVCAGAKAILDLEKTLEVLETNGVPVIGYGCDELPAFWSRESGLSAPLRLDSVQEIADHAAMRTAMGVGGGTIVANPVPQQAELPREEVDTYIAKALGEAKTKGVTGKDVTPFLLQRIFELSEERSLETNIALVLNNANLAAQIAVAICSRDSATVEAARL